MIKPLLDKIYQKRFWLFILGVIIVDVLFIVTYIHSSSFYFTVISGLFMLFICFCFIVSIVLLIILTLRMIVFKAKSPKSKMLLKISCYGVVGCSFIIITSFPICRLLSENQIEGSKKNAHIISEALEKYRKEKGKYPDELKELVPQYLTEIPKAKTKKPFFKDYTFYYSPKEDYYVLEFPGHAWTIYTYYSDTKEWKVD